MPWRFGLLLKAAYRHVHLLVSWLAQDLVATLPPSPNGLLYLFGDGSHADRRGTKNPVAQKGRISQHHPWFFGLHFVLLIAASDGYRVPVGFRLILEHLMQVGNGAVAADKEAPPNRWSDLPSSYME